MVIFFFFRLNINIFIYYNLKRTIKTKNQTD